MEPLPQKARPIQSSKGEDEDVEFLPAKDPLAASYDLDAVVRPSIFCSLCQPIQSWLQANWIVLMRTEHQTTKKSFDHYDTGLKLQESFLSGCHLCTLIWYSCHRDAIPSMKNLKVEVARGGFRYFLGLYETSCEQHLNGDRPIWLGSHVPTKESGLVCSAISTSSYATRQLSENWLRECVTSHARCRGETTQSLPGRILDVCPGGKSDEVQLINTHKLSSGLTYAALSYCWGKAPTYTLTLSSLNDFISGVTVQGFPKTIRDAIQFTRDIGIKWLWIDALCIIQDCPDDWNRESLKMCDVYQNSHLTLAALGASNNDDGLFSLRDPLMFLPCDLFRKEAGETIRAELDIIKYSASRWPLRQRRWALQERTLPTRTLNFGSSLSWNCRERSLSEYAYPILKLGLGNNLSRDFFDVMLDTQPLRISSVKHETAILGVWNTILYEYTYAKLTVQTDSLRAISGIITAVQNRTGWRNLAGLWEPFLWRELLWCRNFSSPGQPTFLKPSWSWISRCGQITPVQGWDLQSISKVEEAGGIIVADQRGEQFAEHRMALFVYCVLVVISNTNYRGRGLPMNADLVGWPWTPGSRYTSDSTTDRDIPDRFLPLAISKTRGWRKIHGLAVIPSVSCPGAFERVGYMFSEFEDLSESADHISAKSEDPLNTVSNEIFAFFEPKKRERIILV
ncbi:HET-domain-containing protein [Lophiostoma macrostomum CBS 122681]|uniref:HET-domain-containing protein n=1 Tax=Lophiostoma macrostomum CBS 122681 TaxID=1314788 RepID=A0A6A6T2Y2_9PLEO|nr:HET-domain-containing protein [Lophiostoma macrostomum CBS 122681]